MILVTGATGKLGRHVMEGLLRRVPATELAIAVRNVAKAADFTARGVAVRHTDYDQPGVPGPYADILVDSDVGASRGELDGASGDLRRLIGRPSTPLRDAIEAVLRNRNAGR